MLRRTHWKCVVPVQLHFYTFFAIVQTGQISLGKGSFCVSGGGGYGEESQNGDGEYYVIVLFIY